MTEWVLVDPVGKTRQITPRTPAERRPGASRKVGFFSNSKQHAAEIEEAMAAAIGSRLPVETVFYTKRNARVGATPELIRSIVQECEIVFAGSGD